MEDSNLPISLSIIIGAIILGLLVFAGLLVSTVLGLK